MFKNRLSVYIYTIYFTLILSSIIKLGSIRTVFMNKSGTAKCHYGRLEGTKLRVKGLGNDAREIIYCTLMELCTIDNS